MDQLQEKLLPEKIKNSVYVHDITDNNVHIYAKLPSIITEKFGFLRHASDGKNLAFVQKIKSEIEPYSREKKTPMEHRCYLERNAQKRLIPLTYDEIGNLKELQFADITDPSNPKKVIRKIIYSSLKEFAANQKLILNLVQDITLTPEDKEKARQKSIDSADAITKINEENLFNHDNFYNDYIKKSNRVPFSRIIGINKVIDTDNNFLLLSFEDNTVALISTKQLFAAMFYDPAPEETKSDDVDMASQAVMPPPPLYMTKNTI